MEVIGAAVVRIRESVAYWVATPKRYEKFEKTVLDENVVLNKKLNPDCKTRCNSTYIMLSIAIPYRKIFERLGELDRNYVCPLENDWIYATTVCEKLELFYELTELFFGTKYVTANLFFPKVCEIKLRINSWGHDEDETIRKMSAAMIAKYDKYWADIHGLMAVAVILDPRLKMTMLHACYIALLGEDVAEQYVAEAHALLTDLMKHYQVKDQEFVSTSSCGASSSVSTADVLSIFKTLAANKKTTSFVRSKNELDRYLDDETLPHDENDYFDVLGWWRLEGTHYPALRLIARDVLSIPITTVASESAFSTSGRLLSEHRSHLTPRMLEALMCSQSWLRHTLKGKQMCICNVFYCYYMICRLQLLIYMKLDCR